jgi:ABC-type sugar transport system permease subunit
LPFYASMLLAGLRTISPELDEAATIDGASALACFRYVTLPLLKPVIFIVTMFSVIFTFADFRLIYVLTRGGRQMPRTCSLPMCLMWQWAVDSLAWVHLLRSPCCRRWR